MIDPLTGVGVAAVVGLTALLFRRKAVSKARQSAVCMTCGKNLHSWRTYADGRIECVACSSRLN